MNRRSLLSQIGAGALVCALPRAVFGRGLDARDFGVWPDAASDQSVIFQRMVDDAWVPSVSLAELAGRMNRDHELLEIASPILGALTRQREHPNSS